MKCFYFPLLILLLSCSLAYAQTASQPKSASQQNPPSFLDSKNLEKGTSLQGPCHGLLYDVHSENLEKTDPEQLLQYMQQLAACTLHDATLSREDLQTAVLLNGNLNAFFYKKIGNSDMNAALKVGMDISKDCTKDYNKLVVRYNDLIDLAQKQHDLLIRLSTEPLSLPALPKPIHCTAMKAGIMTTIDCY